MEGGYHMEDYGDPADMEYGDEEKWEMVNHDGFIYKRRRRSPLQHPLSKAPSYSDQDGHRRMQHRRLRRATLQSLKAKYTAELRQWEALTEMLQQQSQITQSLTDNPDHRSEDVFACKDREGHCKQFFQEFMVQADAQEAFIKNLGSLCNAVEMTWQLQEESLKQVMIGLPVWDASLALMHSAQHGVSPT